MHLAALIRDLALILGVAGLVTLLFQRIRQPVVLGYLIAGVLLGPHTLPWPLVTDLPHIRIWADLGVIFLMFSLGLDFSFRKLAKVGPAAGSTALVEVTCMAGLGYATGRLLGWSTMDSIFLGAMLLSSSTTIILKALEDLNLKRQRFAHLIFGVLVVEDLVVILAMVALSTLVTANLSGPGLLFAVAELVLILAAWILAGYIVIPPLIKHVARLANDEMLTVISVGLCLLLATAAAALGYSIALGAFIMGAILAECRESHHIGRLIGPLRNLFAAVFFVSVGMLIDLRTLSDHLFPVLVIAGVTVLGKIVSCAVGAVLAGQPVKRAVQVGLGLAQIGEFAFIVAGLGMALGVTSEFLYPIGVAVTVITTFTTPYLIRGSEGAAAFVERHLPARVQAFLPRYAAWLQEHRAGSRPTHDLRPLLLRWGLNALVVAILFAGTSQQLLPWMHAHGLTGPWFAAAAWLAALAVSSPFLWAMLTPHGNRRSAGVAQIFAQRMATLAWVAVLSVPLLQPGPVLALVTFVAVLIFSLSYRHLEQSYRWFESHFLTTLEESDHRRGADRLQHLAPWDAHLIRLTVPPHSPLAGRRIGVSRLRTRYGLNILAIQRGLSTLVAPTPDVRIFPHDELLVLGEDAQAEAARLIIEGPGTEAAPGPPLIQYDLVAYRIPPGNPLSGGSIREGGLRERYRIMVVGIEREGRRIINPESDMQLREGDLLWLVGEADALRAFRQAQPEGGKEPGDPAAAPSPPRSFT